MACVVLLSGCAIHPHAKDVTGVSTFVIEQQIRCETRKSVINLTLLHAEANGDGHDRDTVERYRKELEADAGGATSLAPKDFSEPVRRTLDVFWTAGVAYNFTLDMTEVNNVDGEIDLGSLLARRAFGVGLKAGLDRSRQNVETFTVTDNFGELVKDLTGCRERIVGPNYVYPISGEIGVEDMIKQFVYMTIYGGLGGETEAHATVPKGPPTLVDSLVFTTTISGSVSPHVAFAPAGEELGVTAASVDMTASRTDKHQVVVGLALDPVGKARLAVVHNAYFASTLNGAAGSPLVAPLLTAAPRTRAEGLAAAAVNQYLTQTLFSRTIIVPQQ